jgi:hypothetical protein
MRDVLLTEHSYRVESECDIGWIHEGQFRTLDEAKKRLRICIETDTNNKESYKYRIVKITTTEEVMK